MQTESFDYIVVGAGSAGCVVANRLSADPSVKVCLIEAGGSDNSLRVKVPAGIRSMETQTTTIVSSACRNRSSTTAAFQSTAARRWADRARSTRWSISAAPPRIMTNGPVSAAPAGPTATCCPCSGSWSATCLARTRAITAATANCWSTIRAIRTCFQACSSRLARTPTSPPTPTSTPKASLALASTTSRRIAGSASAASAPLCVRCFIARI